MEEGDAPCSAEPRSKTALSSAAPIVLADGAAASYFDNAVEARKLREEALSWVGTPFREYYQQDVEAIEQVEETKIDLKGMGGGIDCIGLAQHIFMAIGASDKFVFRRESSDYQAHGLGDKILDWLRGKVDDPQSRTLAEILVELAVPEKVTDPGAETPRDFFKPGDILVMRHGGLFHMPIIYDDDLHFINAIPRLGVVTGTIQDASFNIHLVAVFRLKPKKPENTP